MHLDNGAATRLTASSTSDNKHARQGCSARCSGISRLRILSSCDADFCTIHKGKYEKSCLSLNLSGIELSVKNKANPKDDEDFQKGLSNFKS